jgi:hypothetical protein
MNQSDPRAMALNAIQRTRQGSNPTMADTTGAMGALNESRAYADRTGYNPDTAFAQRFANSPPVKPGQG